MINYGAAQLAAAFRTVRTNTVKIAEEIPETEYGFTPAAGTRAVGALLVHIAVAQRLQYDMHAAKRIRTTDGYDFFGIGEQLRAEEHVRRSKAEIIALLQKEGESFAAWLASLDDAFLNEEFAQPYAGASRTRFESIMSAKEHEMHHRGQLMLIERMLGIVPHLTRAFQERAEARRKAQMATAG
jgi:uncharacterized damage-inducible protein DinB